jgi:hypothetical protein
MELPDWELGRCERLQRGLGRSLRASRYLGKNTGVVDSEFASLPHLYLPHLHCYLGCVLYFPSLVDRLVDMIGA